MRVVVSGGTGVIGRAAVPAMLAAGHDVHVLCRSQDNEDLTKALGAVPVTASIFDVEDLTTAFAGADAVVNLATRVPVGYAAVLGQSWRRNDELRTQGVACVIAAARRAGVRRVVQGSASFLYADRGDARVDEASEVDITPATEPLAVGEAHVQQYAGAFARGYGRAGVLLRFGTIVGDDPQTRFWLRAAANGRPIGIGRPEQWSHLVHTDDLGGAIVAALAAPSGVYNVGAAPVRRAEIVAGYAQAVGAPSGAFLGPVLRRFAGARIEPWTRSLRVSSDRFTTHTGWQPSRAVFGPDWLDAALSRAAQPQDV